MDYDYEERSFDCEECGADLSEAQPKDYKSALEDHVNMFVRVEVDDPICPFYDAPGAVPREGWAIETYSQELLCPECGHDNGASDTMNVYRPNGRRIDVMAALSEVERIEGL